MTLVETYTKKDANLITIFYSLILFINKLIKSIENRIPIATKVISSNFFRKLLFIFIMTVINLYAFAQSTQIQYLSGTDKDHTVQWDFYCTQGRNSGKWTKIAVPSCWELQGFGTYHYGLDEPFDSVRGEKGIYKYDFNIPTTWKGRRILIVFGGVMTDAQVNINGQSAGPIHQGSFYQFKYDITDLLHYDSSNALKVTVSKISADSTVNHAERRADYWVFGGIYRPVYLEAVPTEYIKRVAINAEADGALTINAFIKESHPGDEITAQLFTANDVATGNPFSAQLEKDQLEITLQHQFNHPKTWSPEFPHLYKLKLQLIHDRKTIHEVTQSFGFRTIEVRKGQGIYLNGHRILLKGICRHSFWPSSGLTTSKQVSIEDVNLIKSMNMNAVRTAHSPPDISFLNVCDSMGLLVLDELTGWHASYDTKLGDKLVKEMVTRDVNHPCVIFLDNGNEEGWNTAFDTVFDKYDPQKRLVLHPGDYKHPDRMFNGIYNQHYESYDQVKQKLQKKAIYFPTEFLHALYDGGGGTGLYDYWSLMKNSPHSGGGFIWDFLDEGVVRTDENDRIDVNGNKAPDGVVGPYRQKEGSYYAIKEIWSPVQIQKSDLQHFDGRVKVDNEFYFTNLNQCTFQWQLIDFPKPLQPLSGYRIADQGKLISPSIPPQDSGYLHMDLPANWRQHDALFLIAVDPHGREIYQWAWMISSPAKVAAGAMNRPSNKRATAIENKNNIVLIGGNTKITISKMNGEIISVTHRGQTVSFNNGPQLVEDTAIFSSIRSYPSGNDHVVEVNYKDHKKWIKYSMNGSGWLRMDYHYAPSPGPHHFIGITFSYPATEVNSIRWLGKGPYRVWKNRMQGVTYNVWTNHYNDTRTGEAWSYPEFKGYFANMYWAQIQTDELPITVITASKNIFLRLLTPQYGVDPHYTAVMFPKKDISFLQAIDPMGTKVHKPEELGPQGHLYEVKKNAIYKGTLYFYFGEP